MKRHFEILLNFQADFSTMCLTTTVEIHAYLGSRDQQTLQLRILDLLKGGFKEEKERLRWKFREICMFIQTWSCIMVPQHNDNIITSLPSWNLLYFMIHVYNSTHPIPCWHNESILNCNHTRILKIVKAVLCKNKLGSNLVLYGGKERPNKIFLRSDE